MDGHPVKFSIGIPAFKGRFFEECLGSILNQTYTNFELIVVDDCSPDDLKSIVDKANDPRIRYYRNAVNTGAEKVVNNWNKALEFATGEFFVLMGDDDCLEPTYIETFYELISKHPNVDVYHCRSKIINENSVPFKLTPSWPDFESAYDSIWHRLNEHRAQYISDFLYRVTALKENGGFYYLPLAWGSDDVTAYRAASTNGLVHTNKSVFKYRSSQYSITSTGNGDLKMEAVILYYQWITEFLSSDPLTEDDKIVCADLKRNLRKYLQKKKMHTIASSMGKSWLSTYIKWIKQRKKYDLSYKELAYSLIEYFKKSAAKSAY